MKNIFYYLQGNIRYFLLKNFPFLVRKHIREQVEYRMSVMDEQCREMGSCKYCGCDVPQMQMSDKQCKKPCYPKMMGKKKWESVKRTLWP